MKTVTIEGKEYEVPDKAGYVAMDEDGEWHWFENEPKVEFSIWDAAGENGFITNLTPWKSTLRKI